MSDGIDSAKIQAAMGGHAHGQDSRTPIKSVARARRGLRFVTGMLAKGRPAPDVIEGLVRAGAQMTCEEHRQLTGDIEALLRYAVSMTNLTSVGHNTAGHGSRAIEDVIAETLRASTTPPTTLPPGGLDFNAAGL